jgi:succinate dehydrogenase/fumarate reductase flavoprotein subunit
VAEVVVVGGGMSGLCAGIAAADAGASVTVLEAGPQPGGSMALSGGLVWTARSLEAMRAAIPRGSAALQAVLVAGIDAGWRWLEEHGVPLGPERPCMVGDFGRGRLFGLGAPSARGPVALALAAALEKAGGTLVCSCRVSAVTEGFTVHTPDGDLRADAVVFAGGGFQNDRSLLRRYVTPYADALVIRSNPFSDGIAVRSIPSLGAALSDGMASFYGHSLPVTPSPIEPADFLSLGQFYSNHCVIVNLRGERFTDETRGLLDECNAQAGALQPGGRYFLLFDEYIRVTHVSAGEGLPGVVNSQVGDRLALVRSRGGTVLTAGTLADLAAQLSNTRGVPAAAVVAVATPLLAHSPFYAVECVAGITYPMGGLAVDPAMRVLDPSGAPVPGLYAAGADAGHVFEDVYGGGLAWALVSGIMAGSAAACARTTADRGPAPARP